jgi:hypothetical protein
MSQPVLPSRFWDEHWKLVDRWNALDRDWNRIIPLIDGLRDVGRPLAASEAQAAYVLKLHRQRKSLRSIADETSLSLRTVRTIIGRAHFSDRTSMKRRKIATDQHERALEVPEANRRRAAPAGLGRDRDRQGAGTGGQGAWPGGADLSRYRAVCDCAA